MVASHYQVVRRFTSAPSWLLGFYQFTFHFSWMSPLSGNYLPTFSSSLTDIRALELTAAVSSWIRESGRFEQWAAGRLLTQHSSQDSLQDTLGQFNHLEILLLLFWVESERAAALSNKQPVAYSTLTAGLTRAIRPSWKTALAVELLFWVGSERAARFRVRATCFWVRAGCFEQPVAYTAFTAGETHSVQVVGQFKHLERLL